MAQQTASASGVTKVYRVEGFTCANCAGKFEDNVRKLPGVIDAKVNFAAAKITVTGEATIAELEEAGAFERLKVVPEDDAAGVLEDRERGIASFVRRNAELIAGMALLLAGTLARLAPGDGRAAAAALLAASIVVAGHRLFRAGLKNITRLDFDMRTLMTVAIIGAAAIGEWIEGAVVVVLFALSEALERYTMERARRSIRGLMELAPREALVLRNGRETAVRADEVAAGDTLIVRPGAPSAAPPDVAC